MFDIQQKGNVYSILILLKEAREKPPWSCLQWNWDSAQTDVTLRDEWTRSGGQFIPDLTEGVSSGVWTTVDSTLLQPVESHMKLRLWQLLVVVIKFYITVHTVDSNWSSHFQKPLNSFYTSDPLQSVRRSCACVQDVQVGIIHVSHSFSLKM